MLTRWQAMLIEVSMVGRLRSFINPLQDDQAHPAQQLAELHCQRWEIEVGFQEIKPPQQEGKPLLRSKLPARVSQASA